MQYRATVHFNGTVNVTVDADDLAAAQRRLQNPLFWQQVEANPDDEPSLDDIVNIELLDGNSWVPVDPTALPPKPPLVLVDLIMAGNDFGDADTTYRVAIPCALYIDVVSSDHLREVLEELEQWDALAEPDIETDDWDCEARVYLGWGTQAAQIEDSWDQEAEEDIDDND